MVMPEPPQSISPAWELTSVLAECTAFFFVTIDLYGEERLRALNQRISWVLSSTLAKLRFSFSKDEPLAIGSINGFITHWMGLCFGLLFWLAKSPPVPPLLQPIMKFGHGMSLFFVITFALGLALDVLFFIPALALWLITKLKFKGVLLTFGALLFVFAKGILIMHLVHEVHFPLLWPFKSS